MKPVHVVVRDLSTDARFTKTRFFNAVAAVEQQLKTHFNDSPWVEHGYVAPFGSFTAIEVDDPIPTGVWVVEFIDDDPNAPGALGYHEDQVFNHEARDGQPSKASTRSMRGLAKHPDTGALVPVLKILVKTTYDDGEWPSEVFSHEALEALVDPFVTNEASIRRYLNVHDRKWYIGEICDAVQGRGYKIKGVLVSDGVYPGWFEQPQTRTFTTIAEEYGYAPRVEPFEVTSAGYMSVAPQNEPTNWTQIGPGQATTTDGSPVASQGAGEVPRETAEEGAQREAVEAGEREAEAHAAAGQDVTVEIDAEGKGSAVVDYPLSQVNLVAQPTTGTASLEPVDGQMGQTCIAVVNAVGVSEVSVPIAVG